MVHFLHRIIPKKLKSGTPQHPAPINVFNSLIDDVVTDKGELDKAYFSTKSCKGWAEVYLKNDGIIVNFKFPFKNSPEEIFTEKRLGIPDNWCEGACKVGKKITFRIGKKHKDSIGPFLDLVFRKLYDCPEDYILRGKMVLGLWQMTG
ncbi:MAG: hypothetical protein PHQ00_05105 [Phycisphaerae bacterium]|nr:hypothetical protein [Phycisphaerae bacterium]